jgi:membrane protease YdiL (CAAX protease family)
VPTATVIVVGVLLLLGLVITAWVFVPAFRGRERAAAALGTHRLALGSIVAVVVLNAILTLPLAPFLRLDRGLTSGTFVLAAAATQIPMLLVVYVRLVRPGVMTWQQLGLRARPLEYVLRFGLGAGIIGLVAIELVGSLLSQVGLRPNQLDQFQFVLREGPLALAVLLVSAGILAPFVEELFFRGFLFGTYRRRQPAWVAYLASSLLFTVLHLEPNRMNAAQMAGLSVGIFMLALLLAWLYDHTGSLWPGMVAHAVNNATGLILFYAVGLR